MVPGKFPINSVKLSELGNICSSVIASGTTIPTEIRNGAKRTITSLGTFSPTLGRKVSDVAFESSNSIFKTDGTGFSVLLVGGINVTNASYSYDLLFFGVRDVSNTSRFDISSSSGLAIGFGAFTQYESTGRHTHSLTSNGIFSIAFSVDACTNTSTSYRSAVFNGGVLSTASGSGNWPHVGYYTQPFLYYGANSTENAYNSGGVFLFAAFDFVLPLGRLIDLAIDPFQIVYPT